jgi:hypothetical protein
MADSFAHYRDLKAGIDDQNLASIALPSPHLRLKH